MRKQIVQNSTKISLVNEKLINIRTTIETLKPKSNVLTRAEIAI